MKPETEEDRKMNLRQVSKLRSLLGIIRIAAACFVLWGAVPTSLRAATITVCSTGDNGPGTLRAALASASNGDTIDLYSCAFGTILLTSGQLVVTNSVSIIGPGGNIVKISGNSSYRVFYVASNTTVTIAGLLITDGSASSGGGGIWNDQSTLTVSNCSVSGNYGGAGGGILNNSGTLTLTASTLSGNSAYVFAGTSYGAGIYNAGALSVIASTLSSNVNGYHYSYSTRGGGIFNLASITVTDCTFSGNADGFVGGGIYNYGGTGTVSASTLSGNSAPWGGAINNDASGLLTVINCALSGNLASGQSGGGIDNGGTATITVKNCTLSDNAASDRGGGIVNFGTMTVSASTLSGNSAVKGGGINNYLAVLTVSNSTISGNSATGQGGGILNTNGTLTVMACTLNGNSALNGGGILNAGPSAQMQIGNTILNAGDSGGNITNAPGTLVFLSRGYNLSSDPAGGHEESTGSGGLLSATGDIRNTDPMLGPLADNGGPTFTHALLPGSPATHQGKSFGLTADQRGFPRPYPNPCISNPPGGDGSDIGAFVVQTNCELVAFQTSAIQQIGSSKDLRLTFPTVLGSNYVVQTRSNMVSGSWTSLPGTNTGIGVVMQSIVTNALTAPQGFYRIQQLP